MVSSTRLGRLFDDYLSDKISFTARQPNEINSVYWRAIKLNGSLGGLQRLVIDRFSTCIKDFQAPKTSSWKLYGELTG